MGAGYFGDSGHFDDAVIDYTTNDGNDVLYGAGGYDENILGGDLFGNNTYGD